MRYKPALAVVLTLSVLVLLVVFGATRPFWIGIMSVLILGIAFGRILPVGIEGDGWFKTLEIVALFGSLGLLVSGEQGSWYSMLAGVGTTCAALGAMYVLFQLVGGGSPPSDPPTDPALPQ